MSASILLNMIIIIRKVHLSMSYSLLVHVYTGRLSKEEICTDSPELEFLNNQWGLGTE
jgi:hypothetical protein